MERYVVAVDRVAGEPGMWRATLTLSGWGVAGRVVGELIDVMEGVIRMIHELEEARVKIPAKTPTPGT